MLVWPYGLDGCCVCVANMQIRVGSDRVYICSTGDGSILELAYPSMKLVRCACVCAPATGTVPATHRHSAGALLDF